MPTTTVSSPTPDTTAADVAAKITVLLDQIEALIHDFPAPDPSRAAAVRANARFASELVTPTITAVANYEPLRARHLFDADAGREALVFRDQLRPVAQRIAILGANVDFAVNSKLADAAVEALQTYQWSKRHAKQADGAGLRPYVNEMQRVVEKTINHRAKHEDAGTPPAPKEPVTA